MKGRFLLTAWALISLFWSCRTWDLSDPALREALVDPVNQGNYLIKLHDSDYPFLEVMLADPDPQTRMAALKLAEYNLRQDLFIPLLEATLDSIPEISHYAQEILLRNGDSFFPWATSHLEDLDYEYLLPALELLARGDYRKGRRDIIGLFYLESKAVSRAAAKALPALTDLDDPDFLAFQHSENPIERKAYYQILFYYNDPELIPLILEGLDDPDPQVWGMSVSLLYNFGKGIVPYLEEQLERNDYRRSLAVIQILEKIRIPEGIPLLVRLTSSSHQSIAQRSAIQLQSYGEQIFPALSQAIPEASERQLRIILWILSHIDSTEAIPLYLQILQLDYPWAPEEALKGLSRWGEETWQSLRPYILISDEPLNFMVMHYLRERGDPRLLTDDKGLVQEDYGLMLILYSTEEELISYAHSSLLADRYSRELLEIYEIFKTARRWSEIKNLAEQEGYVSLYLQWEETLLLARQKRLDARYSNQAYFNSSDRQNLEDSRRLRAESEALELEARQLKRQLESLAVNDPEGKARMDEWLELRSRLTQFWRELSPSFKTLADRIYQYWGIHGDELLKISRNLRGE